MPDDGLLPLVSISISPSLTGGSCHEFHFMIPAIFAAFHD
jgi:hypothetical protein